MAGGGGEEGGWYLPVKCDNQVPNFLVNFGFGKCSTKKKNEVPKKNSRKGKFNLKKFLHAN